MNYIYKYCVSLLLKSSFYYRDVPEIKLLKVFNEDNINYSSNEKYHYLLTYKNSHGTWEILTMFGPPRPFASLRAMGDLNSRPIDYRSNPFLKKAALKKSLTRQNKLRRRPDLNRETFRNQLSSLLFGTFPNSQVSRLAQYQIVPRRQCGWGALNSRLRAYETRTLTRLSYTAVLSRIIHFL